MNRNITNRLLFLVALVACANASWGHTGSMRGTVSESNRRKPLEGVGIYVPQANLSAVTDAFGHFFIKGVEPGRYSILISHIGFETISDSLSVEDGITTDLSFVMATAAVSMADVTINAKKDQNLNAISGLDLKLRPVNNSQDLMRLVPGLFTAQHQGGGKAEQIFLRGFDCDHGTDINVSVDNMPVNMVSHCHGQGFADTHFIIPEAVQEVDYGKGAYQADKGDLCTAGFVAFKTRNALDNSFVKVEGGMYDYFRTVAGINLFNRKGDNGHQDAYVMGEYGYNRGYFDQSQNFNRFNLVGKYTNYIAPGKMLSLTLSGFNSGWDASGQIPTRAVADGITDRYGNLDPESGNTSRYNLNLQYVQSINSNAYFKSNIYLTYYTFKLFSDFTYFLNDPVEGDKVRQGEQRAMGGYNGEYSRHDSLLGFRTKSQLGIGLRYDNVMDDELSHVSPSFVLLDRIALGDVHQTNLFAYASQSVDLSPQLVLTVGGRYDYFIQQYIDKLPADNIATTENGGRFSPKAGLYYNFTDNARIYYSYGTGFHTNDTRTLALGRQISGDVSVNHTIPASYGHDLGIIVKPVSKLLISGALWLLDLQQEFSYSGDEAVIDTAGKTRRYGIDFSARYELLKWLYMDVDVNYAHARELDQQQGSNYIPLAPSFTSIGGLTFKISKSIAASIRYRHISDRPANADNTLTALGYTVCDAVVNYSRPHYEFGMQIQNLLNTQWNEAQFATETRLRLPGGNLEAASHTDVCYTPGTPFLLKLSAAYKF